MNRIERVKPPEKGHDYNIVSYIREDLDILSVIFVLALVLRIYYAAIAEFVMPADFIRGMVEIDKSVLGNGLNVIQPPLHALFLRIMYVIFGAANHRAVFMLQGVLSSVIVLFMYVTGRLLFGRKAGILAASISAVYPNFIIYNLGLNSDSISLVIVTLLMATAVIQAPESGKACLSAALISVGILFKPLLVYFLPGMLLTAKKRMMFIVVVFVILVPWAIRNSVVQGSFTPVYGKDAYKVNLRHFTRKYEKWAAVHKIYFNCATVLKRSWTSSFADDEDDRLRNSSYIATYSHVIIMLLGLIGIVRYRRKEQLGVVAPVAGYLILLVMLSDFRVRYRIFFELLLILYAAAVVSRFGSFIWNKVKSLRLRGSSES